MASILKFFRELQEKLKRKQQNYPLEKDITPNKVWRMSKTVLRFLSTVDILRWSMCQKSYAFPTGPKT